MLEHYLTGVDAFALGPGVRVIIATLALSLLGMFCATAGTHAHRD